VTAQPELTTDRLLLRPFAQEDAPALQRLASQREIADTMISVPHPFPAGEAARRIRRSAEAFGGGSGVHFAITLRANPELIGAIELREIDPEHSKAELSLWIASGWWGQGYATEAVPRLLAYGFDEVGLNRITAHHMTRNPASGRVLLKCGFKCEGLLRKDVRKWGVFEDVVLVAILREEWAAQRAGIPNGPRLA
jgi:RimJ/RimL family protein N-acetyltransferase